MPEYNQEDFKRISKDFYTNRNVNRTSSETTRKNNRILKTIADEITAERIDYKQFIEKLPLINAKILKFFAEGYSLGEISEKLKLSYEYVKEKYEHASFIFSLEISSGEKNRLRGIRNALGITQEEIAEVLRLTKDAYSKFERGHFELTDDNKKKVIEYIINNIRPPLDLVDAIDNSEILFQWHRVLSLFFAPDTFGYDLIAKNKGSNINYMLYFLLEYYGLLHKRQRRFLNSIIYIDIFDSFNGLNMGIIKDYLNDNGKKFTYLEIIKNLELVKAGGLKFCKDFNNVRKEFLKIEKKKEDAVELLGFFYSVYKSSAYKDKYFLEELFFGYPKIDKDKAKAIAEKINTFMKEIT